MAMITADPQDVPRVESFAFAPEYLAKAQELIARYPAGRQASAVIGCLDLAQRQSGGWLPRAAMDHVAALLEMAPIRVYEIATFYTMFHLKPRGTYLLQVCTTTPCWLRGSDGVMKACRDVTGVAPGEVSADGLFTTVEVECLGACVNAPMMQINDDFYEDLDPKKLEWILDELAAGRVPPYGSQTGRKGAEPEGGPTTLKDIRPKAPAE
jgi:NADH-quinone oxidoreductase subunit E